MNSISFWFYTIFKVYEKVRKKARFIADTNMTLNQLKLGQSAVVQHFTDDFLSLKFIEMGCLPGEVIKLVNVAPMQDPIAIEVSGYVLSLRKEEASTIEVILLHDVVLNKTN